MEGTGQNCHDCEAGAGGLGMTLASWGTCRALERRGRGGTSGWPWLGGVVVGESSLDVTAAILGAPGQPWHDGAATLGVAGAATLGVAGAALA